MTELFYEDIELGGSAEAGEYEVTEQEILEFGRRFDPRPFHSDAQAAAASAFGELVASGCPRLLHPLLACLADERLSGPP